MGVRTAGERYGDAGSDWWFGNAADGNVTISGGTTTLTSNKYYNNLTIAADGILKPAGFGVFVKKLLSVASGGVISADGNDGSGATAGAQSGATGSTMAGIGAAGGAGGANANGSAASGVTSVGMGGAGAAGGASGVRTGGALGNSALGSSGYNTFYNPFSAMHGGMLSTQANSRGDGGGGGGGGAGEAPGDTGGGGGSGGASLHIRAKSIVNNGAIRANGGAGAAGTGVNAGGGGGGGGGVVVIFCESYVGNAATATGGAGGAAVGGGSAGGTGSDGKVHLFKGR